MKPLFRAPLSLLLPLLLLSLSACGGNDGSTPEAATEVTEATEATNAADAMTASADLPRLNINTATEEEMLRIPGVGNRMVHEFEEYRPYVSIQQFRREIGKYVDEEQVAAYEQYIFVPINPNESDLETLLQVPGLDTTEAQALIDGRPYASREAFLERLAGYVSPDELAEAETYLTDEG
ncbi:MAG: hypothetical protein D6685_04230 [Bacteroidetes bacterium]|nr:MAG: hypothetical protein D6685_04230 [Bacteroidota bacterium]